MKKMCCVLGITVSLMFCTGIAQSEISETKIIADDGSSADRFGDRACSIQGDYAAVGAFDADDKGAVYIFKQENSAWNQKAKISVSDGENGDRFGRSVSLDGEYLAIGAEREDNNGQMSGGAYIYKRIDENWTLQAQLIPDDNAAGDFFGNALSLSGDYLAVSSMYDNDNGENSGSVYIYKRNGAQWDQQTKLTPSDAQADDYFGRSVEMENEYIIIGKTNSGSQNNNGYGAAYVFKRDGETWTEQAKLTPSDGAADYFGLTVSISGEHCAISASYNDNIAQDTGAVYIFKREGSSWAQQAKLFPADGEAQDLFGSWLSLEGEHLAVGSPQDDNGSDSDSGSVYLYEGSGSDWNQINKLNASDRASGDLYGFGLDFDGKTLLVGAYGDDDSGSASGSAYIYDLGFLSPPAISLVPDNTAPVIGDSLCVSINIADSEGLYSSAFDLTYDPTALQYLTASEGGFLNSDGGMTFFEASLLNGNPATGIVVIGTSRVADIGMAEGSGTIATACFTVIGGSGADTSFGIEKGYFEGSQPGTPIEVVEGESTVIPIEIGVPANLTITDPGTLDRLDLSWDAALDASGYKIYRSTVSGGSFLLIGTSADASYQDNDCILTHATYYYKVKAVSSTGTSTGDFSNEASGSITGLAGDINRDNRVDGRDLTVLARAFNSINGDTDYDCQADLDRSGTIDGDDLVILTAGFGDLL